jgi:succinate dehydrogenase / fumarate reductase flavoprotein subunit
LLTPEGLAVGVLFVADRQFGGVLALDVPRGNLSLLKAKACILATGGAGRIFGQSSNALINTGDGLSLAYRAGLPVKDMEFFQIHPTGLPNGILITEGSRGEGAFLLNSRGERFMQRYAPKFLELAPRDQVSRAIQAEINEGRGVGPACPSRPATLWEESKNTCIGRRSTISPA